MTNDRMAEALRDAVEERLEARLAETKARRDARKERLAELHRRRQHGLKKRHAAKLARLAQDQEVSADGR